MPRKPELPPSPSPGTIPLERRQEVAKKRIKEEQGTLQAVIVEAAATAGIRTPETEAFLVGKMRASSDPGIPGLADGLAQMFRVQGEGSVRADQKNFAWAFWIHVEVLALREAGLPEYDIRVRAVRILRAEKRAAREKVLAERTLLDIYTKFKPQLLNLDPRLLEDAAFLKKAVRRKSGGWN